MTGHVYRRYRVPQAHLPQPGPGAVRQPRDEPLHPVLPLRPLLPRYAGGRDFDGVRPGNHVYFGRAEDGVLESEFSGNLVEVCPTGVFTDKTLKRALHPQVGPADGAFDLRPLRPRLQHDPRRALRDAAADRNRYNGEVNGYFLCDRGRYGYEFVNSERRVRQVSLHPTRAAEAAVASKEDALKQAASLLAGKARVIGIGSPRASLEANFALRTLVGRGPLLRRRVRKRPPARHDQSRHPAKGPCALALAARRRPARRGARPGRGRDETAPMLALALRQSARRQPLKRATKLQIPDWDDAAVRNAIQQERGPLFVATAQATGWTTSRRGRIAPLPTTWRASASPSRRRWTRRPRPSPACRTRSLPWPKEIAAALKEAERPLVVSGAGCGSEAVHRAAANVAWALQRSGRPAELCLATPECNSLGLALMGGGSLDAAFEAARQEERARSSSWRTTSTGARTAQRSTPSCAAKHVIVIDHTAGRDRRPAPTSSCRRPPSRRRTARS